MSKLHPLQLTSGVDKRRKQIDKFRQPLSDNAIIGHPRHPHHHWRMRGNLEVGVFAPLAVLAQLPAVVAPERDDRRVVQAQVLQRGQDLAWNGDQFSFICIF